MKKRKLLCLFLAIAMVMSAFGACAKGDSENDETKKLAAEEESNEKETEKVDDKTEESVGLFLHYDMTVAEDDAKKLVDKSGQEHHGKLHGKYEIDGDELFLEDGGYVELPKGMFDGKNTLTINMWLNNYTGAGNYSAMFIGTTEKMPQNYWLFNPCNPAGVMKSVMTNSVSASAPYNTEVGISASKGTTITGPSTGIGWAMYTTIITEDSITAYYNGEFVGTQDVKRTITDYGEELVSYLGKSSYDDPTYVGFIKDVKVYDKVLTADEIKAEYESVEKDESQYSESEYTNPLIEERADPYIIKGNDGYYYFTASYPMRGGNDKDGYDRVILRRATTLEGLADAEEICIWDESEEDSVYNYIWAPELHYIGGKWYVYFAGSASRDNVFDVRCQVLVCDSDDPYTGKWTYKGMFEATDGDDFSFSFFSLDMTYFENNGTHYVIWAQKPGDSNLYMATINPDEPWKLTSKPITLATPEYYWEKVRYSVCEGPSVLKHNGKIFVCYSAAGTGPEYCVGLLTADATSDLMKVSSWTKSDKPLLTSEDLYQEYGPGHNSFTIDENGDYVFVYHARSQECFDGECGFAGQDPLVDPCRHARLRKVLWAEDGTPILNGVEE